MKRVALTALASLALIACATPSAPAQSPTASVPTGEKDTCGAAQYAGLVGKPITDPGVPPASRLVRHVRPDSIVTMDFVTARLDIDIDKAGIITGLRCG